MDLLDHRRDRAIHPVVDPRRPRDDHDREQQQGRDRSRREHGNGGHGSLCHRRRLRGHLRNSAGSTLRLRRYGAWRRLRLHRDRRRSGRRRRHYGRRGFGRAHARRRHFDCRHRGCAVAARLFRAAAISHHRTDRARRHHAAHYRRAEPMRFLFRPTVRPFTILAGAILVLALIDRGTGYFFSLGTVFSVMQLFATLGLVALGLGLSMMVREFDLSVAGMVGLAGCIAVMTGASHPWLGVLLGVGAGVVSGTAQGFIMTQLGLSSVGVTLGGLLTLQGITYVLTGNATISYPNMSVALGLNAPIVTGL